jgi:hypothetical protein
MCKKACKAKNDLVLFIKKRKDSGKRFSRQDLNATGLLRKRTGIFLLNQTTSTL